MTDWSASMQQTYEFYEVDAATWKDKSQIRTVEKCNITRDRDEDTLGYATIDCADIDKECYIREYLVTVQNGVTDKHPLGIHLVQTTGGQYDGKRNSVSCDAYTPLLELKDQSPPLGYTILAGENIMDMAYKLCRENIRAPVVNVSCTEVLHEDFVANTDDTWLSFLIDLISMADYQFDLDEMGRVLFAPVQDAASLKPIWTFDDSNSSILYPELEVERDLYGIPNVVEVVYSSSSSYIYSKVVNDDSASPISTVNRGREVVYRDTNPSISGIPTQTEIDAYAKSILKSLSTLEYTVSYKHGYVPVRVGDCVLLDYEGAGIKNVKAKIISQEISCETGCPVTEKAVYTNKLWG